ncbi:MAG TPA: HAD family acid phosphatase, partial [Steroidobacteraceae bacterium]|nr:HAD family acid phosphatase [Steroidobacteraceae bacterium]
MRSWKFVVACLMACAASADEQAGRETLNATLWMQRAPEYRALTEQVYRVAMQKIAAPAAGSAALEQQGLAADVLARLPTAVVMDLDETVLDNTVYQARQLQAHANFDPKTWGEWVGAGEAEAIPGAREFIAAARQLGHTVFFLSNRDCVTPAPTADDPCPAKTATLNNLVRLGIDLAPDPEHLLLRKERPEWSASAKTERRAFIGEKYRIIALVGDDLGDFVDPKVFAGDRARLEAHFGTDWFLLPNPIYGSWTAPYESLEAKYAGLRTAEPVLDLPGIGV